MKPLYLLIVFVILVGGYAITAKASPLHVMERDGLVIKLMSEPCSDPTASIMIAMAPKELQDGEWKAIESIWPMQDGSKRPYGGCWREIPKELASALTGGKADGLSFLMLFADQQGIVITKKQFYRKKGQVDA